MRGVVAGDEIMEGRRILSRKEDERCADHGLGREPSCRERRSLVPCPGLRHRCDQRFGHQRQIGERCGQAGVGRRDDEADMALALEQGRDLHVARGFGQGDLDVGKERGVAAHQRRQDAVVGRAHERDRQTTGSALAQPLRDLGQGVHPLEHGANVRQPLRAERRQRHASFGPHEERRAQFPFQAHDGLAERRLRHAEPFGGASEVQRLCHRREMPQLPDIHVHILCVLIEA